MQFIGPPSPLAAAIARLNNYKAQARQRILGLHRALARSGMSYPLRQRIVRLDRRLLDLRYRIIPRQQRIVDNLMLGAGRGRGRGRARG